MSYSRKLTSKVLLIVGVLSVLILVTGIVRGNRIQVATNQDAGTGTGVDSSSQTSQVALAAEGSTIDSPNTEVSTNTRTPAIPNTGTLTRTQVSSSRLVIPKIGVDANIQTAGLTKAGTIGIPTNFTDVAWYNGSSKLGSHGVSVIDGHLDGRNTPRAVFYDLSKLSPGDTVKVVMNDTTYTYKVSHVEVYDYKSNPGEIFKSSDSQGHLNLITCTGDWVKNEKTYDERIVVFTDLVE